ncbi:MAG: AI-2E family transporter [Akkermansiaceae bacterium]|nr:AI-2E family transporter [Akkermansiaceae bacterium]
MSQENPDSNQSPPLWKGRQPLLAVIALLLLMGGCFLVIKPFMSALMWAIILSYVLWPLQRVFTRWFRGRRTIAACVVALTVAVAFACPIVLIGMTLAEDGKELAMASRDWLMNAPEEAPRWVSGVPVLGDELAGYWERFAEDRKRWMALIDEEVKGGGQEETPPPDDAEAQGPKSPEGDLDSGQANAGTEGLNELVNDTVEDVTELVGSPLGEEGSGEQPAASDENADDSPKLIVLIGKFLGWARDWLVAAAKAIGNGVIQVFLSAFIAFFLLRDAPELSRRLSVAAERLAGARGQRLVKVARDTVRSVVFGILGTALAQALVAGLGFWIAGVPAVVLLSVLIFFFAVIPYGPPLVWVPAGIWLFSQGEVGMSIFLFIWGLGPVSLVDNFLRPYLISHGSKTPFILIFCGVIGGALAFGLVGLFLGPILLAVGLRLITEWTHSPDARLGDAMDHEAETDVAARI